MNDELVTIERERRRETVCNPDGRGPRINIIIIHTNNNMTKLLLLLNTTVIIYGMILTLLAKRENNPNK